LAFSAAGLVFLGLAMVKHRLAGYSTPKRVGSDNFDGCIAYDMQVVDDWLDAARRYGNGGFSIAGKDVLELGPGSDLGNGLYLLALGANSYAAVDAIDNASRMPQAFYSLMAETLSARGLAGDPSAIGTKVQLFHSPQFAIAEAVGERTFDVVFSNAAFEHFEDIDAVMNDVAKLLRPGGILITIIDLITHSRWIREKDPNNIYRYPDWLYRMFRFKGIPNRLRPHEYRAAAERHGLAEIVVEPLIEDRSQRLDGLTRRFRNEATEPTLLAVTLCARKPAS
jgi:SAM-dependent methyltransferase